MQPPAVSRTLLTAQELTRTYRSGGLQSWFQRASPARPAVDRVSLSIARGETFGLVGESGSGKSTLARLLAGLERPSSGRIQLDAELDRGARRRRAIQMVFQDPAASLDPRWSVRRSLAEPLVSGGRLAAAELDRRIAAALDEVGLPAEFAGRMPHQCSGGQRQRISIARALLADPALLICDEPTSALDVSVQAQILDLLARLQRERALACLFITHNLAVVRHVSTRVGVMYQGRLIEAGPTARVFEQPGHPYTRALIAAIPDPFPTAVPREAADASTASAAATPAFALPAGCPYASSCERATPVCRSSPPPRIERGHDAWVECHHPPADTQPTGG